MDLKQPTKQEVLAAREAAGLSQQGAAELLGLSGNFRWSEYERGVRAMPATSWAVFLLMTGQHPTHRLIRRGVPLPRRRVSQS